MNFRCFAALCSLLALTFACTETESTKTSVDPDLAALMERAEAGDPDAQVELGDHFETGEARNDAEAVKWYRKAALQDHLEGEYSLGVMIYTGRGHAEDRALGLKWIRKSAEAGYLDAQNSLGVLYATGGAGEQNHEISMEWFRKAAEGGHPSAQLSLGARLAEGLTGPRDPEAAARWFERAAEGGLRAAQWRFGLALARGEGIAANASDAYFWLTISGAARTQESIAMLEGIWAKLSEEERTAVQARITKWGREHLGR